MPRYVSSFQIVPDDGKKVEADLPSGHATVVRKIETLARTKLKQPVQKQKQLLVAMSHYEKED